MKNKSTFIEILKGILIGMGMLAPGLSGGVFAVALGVYPRIIQGINTLWKKPLTVLEDLWAIAVGGVIGLILTFFVILTLIEFAPLPFTTLFIGFIIGSIKDIYQKQKSSSHVIGRGFVTLTMMVIIIVLPFLPSQNQVLNTINLTSILTLVGVGFVLAGTLVIPGISGSLVLLVMGFYVYLFDTARAVISSLSSFDLTLITSRIWPFIFVGLGLILGIVVFAFVLGILIKRYEKWLYSGVLGLLLASPFSIFLEAIENYPNLWEGLLWSIPLSLILFGLGLWSGLTLQEKPEGV